MDMVEAGINVFEIGTFPENQGCFFFNIPKNAVGLCIQILC